MTQIQGGTFVMDARVSVPPFCIDATEVTTDAYAACATSGRCVAASTTVDWVGIADDERTRESAMCNAGRGDRANHPINCVDWHQATAYCASRGARLPTEQEWEWTARGGSLGRVYPWGDAPPDAQLCWSGASARSGTCAVGGFLAGDAPGGVHDLAGNVWEWTASELDASQRVYRGGCWSSHSATVVRAPYRGGDPPAARSANIGFRCAKDL